LKWRATIASNRAGETLQGKKIRKVLRLISASFSSYVEKLDRPETHPIPHHTPEGEHLIPRRRTKTRHQKITQIKLFIGSNRETAASIKSDTKKSHKQKLFIGSNRETAASIKSTSTYLKGRAQTAEI